MNVEQFADELLRRYRDRIDPRAAELIGQDLAAGECEVAAISVIEWAPVAMAEIDELERLAQYFRTTDKAIAERVIAKRRKQLAA